MEKAYLPLHLVAFFPITLDDPFKTTKVALDDRGHHITARSSDAVLAALDDRRAWLLREYRA